MLKRIHQFLDNKIVQNVLLAMLGLGGLVNIFTPQIDFFIKSAQLANQILFIYLLIGFLFLFLGKQKLMMTSFIIAACLSLFLKETTSATIKFAKPNAGEKFKVSLINLSAIDSDPNKVLGDIIKNEHDLIIFQEYTPDWGPLISDKLSHVFLYRLSLPRIDVYGLNVLSKHPFERIDTIYYEESPIVKLSFMKGKEEVDVFTTYFTPPIDKELTQKNQEQLHFLSRLIKNTDKPHIVMGIFNQVPWSSDIIDFKNDNHLQFASSGYAPSMESAYAGLFSKPVTFILFSPQMECTRYRTSKADNDEYGVEATLQMATPIKR